MDTKTPFIVSTAGTLVNIPLNALLIYGLDMDVAGAGLGTTLSQAAMSLVLFWIIARGAHRQGVSIRPVVSEVVSSGVQGAPLVVRSLSLQLGVMTTVWIAISMGEVVLGAHQIVRSVYVFTVFTMDALAIAAQALIAHAIGQRNRILVRHIMSRCVLWGTLTGVILMVILCATSTIIPLGFTSDKNVLDIAWVGIIACALWLPLCGAVFMYDGILIGAGDVRYLAFAQIVVPVVYLPLAFGLRYLLGGDTLGLVVVWTGYGCIFMGVRLFTLVLRARCDTWIDKAEKQS